MEKDTTYVALDDSKRKIVVGILRSGDTQPELREIANDPRQIRRLFERLTVSAKARWRHATKPESPATISTVGSSRLASPVGLDPLARADAAPPGPADQDRPARRRKARAPVSRRGTHRHPRPRRERGGRARSRPLPRRYSPRRPPLAASRAQAPRPSRACLSHRHKLEPGSLAADPRAPLRPAAAAARLRGHPVRARASPGAAGRARPGARGRGRHRGLSRARGLAPLLLRDRHAVGDHPPGRGRGLPALPPAARTHGLPRARAE